MPNQAVATPIGAAYAARNRPLSVDAAVRAALSFRPPEPPSFGNEDDVEGPRPFAPDIAHAPATP